MTLKPKPEVIKQGRRRLGAIYTLPSGSQVYLAYRWVADVWRDNERCVADAIRSGKARWAIETSVLIQLRAKHVPYVGVLLRDTGDRFVAPLEAFFDVEKVKSLTIKGYGGEFRALPYGDFTRRAGKILKIN